MNQSSELDVADDGIELLDMEVELDGWGVDTTTTTATQGARAALAALHAAERRENNLKLRRCVCLAFAATLAIIVAAAAVSATAEEAAPEESADTCTGPVVAGPYGTAAYRHLRLDNGIVVVLASDPAAAKAAASVDVGVGSYDDPPAFPGVAHFTEHLLFMGSRRFPAEDGFGETLRRWAGRSNAYTDIQNTNYFFEAAPAGLEESLAVFSGFFDGPLLSDSSAAREVSAVNAEHEKNIDSEYWRLSQLESDLADPRTPVHGFGTGSLATLNATGAMPALRVFHNASYATDNLAVAVIAPAPLDDLERLVRRLFGPLPRSTAHQSPEVSAPAQARQPYGPGFAGRITYVEPLSAGAAGRRLVVRWPVPVALDGSNPRGEVASFLLAQEGAGGLAAVLKEAGYATGVEGGVVEPTSAPTWYARLGVAVDLTEKGEANLAAVVDAVYAYLALYRGLDAAERRRRLGAWYEGRAGAAQVRWALRDGGSWMGRASDLAKEAGRLARTAGGCLARVLRPPALWKWDAAAAEEEDALLAALTPEKSLVFVVSRVWFDAEAARRKEAGLPTEAATSPHYGTRSYTLPVSPGRGAPTAQGAGGSSSSSSSSSMLRMLRLPAEEPALGVTLAEARRGMVPPAPAGEAVAPPVEVGSAGDGLEAYHRRSVFEKPVGELRVRVWGGESGVGGGGGCKWPAGGADGEAAAALRAAARLVAGQAASTRLAAFKYAAGGVGVSYAVDLAATHLELRVSGVAALHARVLARVAAAVAEPPTGGALAAAKEAVSAALAAGVTQTLVFRRAMAVHREELTRTPRAEAVAAAVAAVSAADVAGAVAAYQAGANGTCVLLDVCNAGAALATERRAAHAAALRSAGFCLPAAAAAAAGGSAHDGSCGFLAVPGWHVLQAPNPNSGDANDAAVAGFELGPHRDAAVEARLRLLEQLVATPAFGQLRSREALGYVVVTWAFVVQGAAVLYVAVQGTVRPAGYLDARIENFLWLFAEELRAMPAATYAELRASVAGELRAAPQDVAAESAPFWQTLVEGGSGGGGGGGGGRVWGKAEAAA
eukprot:Rhum_TRINITY_DN7824_c0_g2::Rhum_TRINITY_DN7824_c0_g2_i1::g.24854::m.24854/K01408/IDE, ide; insulysin